MLTDMYVLTGLDGFTSCCDGDAKAMNAELKRIDWKRPVHIVRWKLDDAFNPVLGCWWSQVNEWWVS